MTQTLEVAEDGTITIPHHALPCSKPGARYRLQTDHGEVKLLPENAAVKAGQAPSPNEASWEEWEAEWKALSNDLTSAWPDGLSAVDVISEMRR